jgi:hypothetical protein
LRNEARRFWQTWIAGYFNELIILFAIISVFTAFHVGAKSTVRICTFCRYRGKKLI